MTTKRLTLDPKTPPALSDQAKQIYDGTSDAETDYSDIPDMGDVAWKHSRSDPSK